MLNVLYGTNTVKIKQINSDKNLVNPDIVYGRFINDDGKTVGDTDSIIATTPFTTCANSNDPIANCNSVNSWKTSNISPDSEIQNNVFSHSSYSLDSIDELFEYALEGLDSQPYISISNKNSKKLSTDANTQADDHGDYIEYDDIALKRGVKCVMQQDHVSSKPELVSSQQNAK